MSISTKYATGASRRSSAPLKDFAARRRCTFAMATASRPISTGRSPWASSGASTNRHFRCLLDRASVRSRSRAPLELIGLLGDKDVLVGAIDVATDDVETPEEVAGTIRAALEYVPAERL